MKGQVYTILNDFAPLQKIQLGMLFYVTTFACKDGKKEKKSQHTWLSIFTDKNLASIDKSFNRNDAKMKQNDEI